MTINKSKFVFQFSCFEDKEYLDKLKKAVEKLGGLHNDSHVRIQPFYIQTFIIL